MMRGQASGQGSGQAGKLWGGRFEGESLKTVEAFTESVSFDQALAFHDIRGSQAHARMLAKQGVISAEDAEKIVAGLAQIRGEIERGEFVWRVEREDVHMNIEARLTELVGDAGKRLHTGRSRNDQVALDFRLFVDERLADWSRGLKAVIRAFLHQARQHVETLVPGCTHFQPAQPVTLAQHLLAYAWMFSRDLERVADCRKRVQISPLGAGALAGTTYPLDPLAVAKDLGWERAFANSMDAVSDRDFVLEALFTGSVIMAHLSRLSEEIILWAAPQFGFVALPDAYATGSSIMPQKKNPDVAELTRGKTGRVYGDLMSLLTTVKGLPMTYNRDLQEDKEPFIDCDRTVTMSLTMAAGMVTALEYKPGPMTAALKKGFLNATELADYLVTKGLPFRDAHEVTGKLVRMAEVRGVGLEDLPLAEMQLQSDLIEEDVYPVLDCRAAVERRKIPGGPGRASVLGQIQALAALAEE